MMTIIYYEQHQPKNDLFGQEQLKILQSSDHKPIPVFESETFRYVLRYKLWYTKQIFATFYHVTG